MLLILVMEKTKRNPQTGIVRSESDSLFVVGSGTFVVLKGHMDAGRFYEQGRRMRVELDGAAKRFGSFFEPAMPMVDHSCQVVVDCLGSWGQSGCFVG